jgi:HEPN domain-containing protein
MSGTDPDARAQWEEARRWFAIAEEDLRVAGLCLHADVPSLEAAAYHCQQAAEKLIKGLLVAAALPFRKVHDLDELADHAVDTYPKLTAYLDFCRPLTRWGTLFRYPTLGDEAELRPSKAEISEAVERLISLGEAIRRFDPSEA